MSIDCTSNQSLLIIIMTIIVNVREMMCAEQGVIQVSV